MSYLPEFGPLLARASVAAAAGREDEALAAYRRALPAIVHARASRPFAEDVFRAHLATLQALGKLEDADREFRLFESGATPSAWLIATGLQWARTSVHLELESKYLPLVVNWHYELRDLRWLAEIIRIVQYYDLGRREIAALYRSYNELMQQTAVAATERGSRPERNDGRLRIGYLSSDFRRHVMGDLMLEVSGRHDRRRFEVFAYSSLPEAMEDATTARFRQCCDCFVPVAMLDDPAAARRIDRDRLDLLVDLASNTPQARPGILLCKPAPLIVAHLGDHGTIGLEQVDFKLTDAVADLPDAAAYQIEQPLPMRGCVMPFRRVTPAPPDPAGRSRLRIPAGAVVFGAFCGVIKLSPRALGLWRRILGALPNAFLALSPFTKVELARCFLRLKAAGVPADRVIVVQPSADEGVNRARYRNVDILLDTLPYCGGDSTVAALDMGVPVVTRAGERQAERMGLSILSHLGITDTVAFSDADYVAIASRLATDTAWRAELSARILNRINASGIADLELYTRNLEEAFERAVAQKRRDRCGNDHQ